MKYFGCNTPILSLISISVFSEVSLDEKNKWNTTNKWNCFPQSLLCIKPFFPYFVPHKPRKWENFIYAPTLYSGGILAPNPKAGNILSLEKNKEEFPQRNAFCCNKHLFFCKHWSKMQSSTMAQKSLLGVESYMAEWKSYVLEKVECVLARWISNVGDFSGELLVWKLKALGEHQWIKISCTSPTNAITDPYYLLFFTIWLKCERELSNSLWQQIYLI